MNILAIETSCDETAVALVVKSREKTGDFFTVEGNALYSQIAVHAPYGGVFPMLAKREHARNLVPLLLQTLLQAKKIDGKEKTGVCDASILNILEREPDLQDAFAVHVPIVAPKDINAIAVTTAPGLEPALWVGINFAHALARLWKLPVIPAHHLLGHVAGAMVREQDVIQESTSGKTYFLRPVRYPALALIISGGHTSLVAFDAWHEHHTVGETRDDAVGECYDKVARILGLPYPGGVHIAMLAKEVRQNPFLRDKIPPFLALPRPMLSSKDADFSFSGLKTAVLYRFQEAEREGKINDTFKALLAYHFEEAVGDVLAKKTLEAGQSIGAQTILIGGGVSANHYLLHKITQTFEDEFASAEVFTPPSELSTDNAIMIGIATHLSLERSKGTVFAQPNLLKAEGVKPL